MSFCSLCTFLDLIAEVKQTHVLLQLLQSLYLPFRGFEIMPFLFVFLVMIILLLVLSAISDVKSACGTLPLSHRSD